MYILKETPDDFVVEEVIKNLEILNKGEYCYFTIEKRNRNTYDVVKEIAGKLGMRERDFNIAGIKDKKAVTLQYVSGLRVKKGRLERLRIANCKICFLGYGDERLKLGQIIGNRFKIVVRGLEEPFSTSSFMNCGTVDKSTCAFGKKRAFEKTSEKINVSGKRKLMFIENYFDEQRFAGRNALLGKALVKKEFRKFCFMLRLKWEGGDYVSAIRMLPKKRLIFYINAYQSWLWNRVVAEYLLNKPGKYWKVDYSLGEMVFADEMLENIEVPIIGYGEIEGEFKESYEELLKEEGVKQDDFLIKEMPELVSEGSRRRLYACVKEMKIKYSNDDKHREKSKAEMEFQLGAGSYATIVVKKMFS